MSEPMFLLDAESLMSKWGFGDGDALSDWWWDNFDEDCPFNADDLLYALVVEYLMPKLRAAGWTVELCRIETTHNPVRAERLNGREVDWYAAGHVEFDPPIFAEVTREQITSLGEKLILKASVTARGTFSP